MHIYVHSLKRYHIKAGHGPASSQTIGSHRHLELYTTNLSIHVAVKKQFEKKKLIKKFKTIFQKFTKPIRKGI